MSSVIFEKNGASFATPIPDEFILKYLPSASGSYVKVYLYMFYHYFNAVSDFTLAQAADALGITEADITEALFYWQKKGLLRLQRTEDACRIRFFSSFSPAPTPTKPERRTEAEATKVVRVEQKPVYSPEELSLYQKTPQIRQLFAAAQRFLGGDLSFPNLSLLYSFYDYYRLPVDVIEFLMEHCASIGNTNLRYMEKIVQDWADKGIQTLTAARNQVNYYKNYYPILRALRINGRQPTETEQTYMNRWLQDYRSTQELIAEAAARTLEKTGRPSFPYMDSILKNWAEQQLHSLKDVEQADAGFAARRSAGNSRSAFHTYSPSGNDYDSIGENARRQMFDDRQEM